MTRKQQAQVAAKEQMEHEMQVAEHLLKAGALVKQLGFLPSDTVEATFTVYDWVKNTGDAEETVDDIARAIAHHFRTA